MSAQDFGHRLCNCVLVACLQLQAANVKLQNHGLTVRLKETVRPVNKFAAFCKSSCAHICPSRIFLVGFKNQDLHILRFYSFLSATSAPSLLTRASLWVSTKKCVTGGAPVAYGERGGGSANASAKKA